MNQAIDLKLKGIPINLIRRKKKKKTIKAIKHTNRINRIKVQSMKAILIRSTKKMILQPHCNPIKSIIKKEWRPVKVRNQIKSLQLISVYMRGKAAKKIRKAVVEAEVTKKALLITIMRKRKKSIIKKVTALRRKYRLTKKRLHQQNHHLKIPTVKTLRVNQKNLQLGHHQVIQNLTHIHDIQGTIRVEVKVVAVVQVVIAVEVARVVAKVAKVAHQATTAIPHLLILNQNRKK